jgi:hypothetical protein
LKSSEIVTFNISGGIVFKLSVARDVVAIVETWLRLWTPLSGAGGAPYGRAAVKRFGTQYHGQDQNLAQALWQNDLNPLSPLRFQAVPLYLNE